MSGERIRSWGFPRRQFKGRGALLWVALSSLCGCPKRFDPRADPIKSSPDAEAAREYHEAKGRLDVGEAREAAARFAEFVTRHPNDPLVPSAKIGEARAKLQIGAANEAKELLEPMVRPGPLGDPGDDPAGARARFVLGLILHRTGDYRRSFELLRPFVGTIVSGDEEVELHAVLADDAYHLDDVEEALREYASFYKSARPPERLFVRDRVVELLGRLPPAVAHERRQQLSFLEEHRTPGRAVKDPLRRALGCLLPLSGKGRALGERALRGALLAADVIPGDAGRAGLELVVRDTGSDPTRITDAVDELAKEGVVALVGSPERSEAQLIAARAESLGLPLLELAPDESRHNQAVFKLVRTRSEGAAELVRRAAKTGARSAAILAPDSGYGRAMAQALIEALAASGIRLGADVRYPENTTTFIHQVRQLAVARPDVLFVPAPASQLQLIAPQLAASGVTKMIGVAHGKSTQLYATGDGLSEKFLQSTAKYLEGAVLAPVFYPDLTNERVSAFVDRYRAAYGEEPSSLDALAYDAVHLGRRALGSGTGAVDRETLERSIRSTADGGITGELRFGPTGERLGPPTLFVVEGGTLHPLSR